MQLDIRNVSKYFAVRSAKSSWIGTGRADRQFAGVRDVTLRVGAGECIGLVGESGCGKSTLARIAAGISKFDEGAVVISDGKGAEVAAGSSLTVQMIFQNPMASLNPRQRVGAAVSEAAVVHRLVQRGDQDAFVARLFEQVGLDPTTRGRFPHEFSGGQRQRIALARALAVNPSILVLDEAVSALDVSIQLKIIDLLRKLQRDLGLGMLFISHDLEIVRSICGYVYVMHLGRVVEHGSVDQIFQSPQHPYTKLLLSSVLRVDEPLRGFEDPDLDLRSPSAPLPG